MFYYSFIEYGLLPDLAVGVLISVFLIKGIFHPYCEYRAFQDARRSLFHAIGSYREGNDWLGNFINECCEVDKSYQAKSGDLYNRYREYCNENGEYTRSTSDFYAALEQAGYRKKKTNHGNFIMGLSIISDFLD